MYCNRRVFAPRPICGECGDNDACTMCCDCGTGFCGGCIVSCIECGKNICFTDAVQCMQCDTFFCWCNIKTYDDYITATCAMCYVHDTANRKNNKNEG